MLKQPASEKRQGTKSRDGDCGVVPLALWGYSRGLERVGFEANRQRAAGIGLLHEQDRWWERAVSIFVGECAAARPRLAHIDRAVVMQLQSTGVFAR